MISFAGIGIGFRKSPACQASDAAALEILHAEQDVDMRC